MGSLGKPRYGVSFNAKHLTASFLLAKINSDHVARAVRVYVSTHSVVIGMTVGGGYSYRLCPKTEEVREECFQRTPLRFANNVGLESGGVCSSLCQGDYNFILCLVFSLFGRMVVINGYSTLTVHELLSPWSNSGKAPSLKEVSGSAYLSPDVPLEEPRQARCACDMWVQSSPSLAFSKPYP